MTNKSPPVNTLEPAESIVSVNSRGGGASGVAGKIAFAVLILAVLLIGILYSVNRYRAIRAADLASAAEAHKSDGRPAEAAGRRVFTSDPPALPEGAHPAPPKPPAPDPRCGDGSASTVLMGSDQQPMRTPEGQELRICRNGQVLIPGLQYAQQPPPLPGAGAAPPATAMPSLPTDTAPRKSVSRYGGDVVLSSGRRVPAAVAQVASAPTDAAVSSGLFDVAPAATPAPSRVDSASAVAAPQPSATPLSASTSQPVTVRATRMVDRDLILPQDRSIDCNLSMRLVSEVAGRATCVLSSYVYGDTGRVVLAEPGTVVSGEYGALTMQGQRRVYIVWQRLKTPRGVVVQLESPAADAMGTSGLSGTVDNRWGARVGAAFLLSMVQDAVSYQTAKDASTGSAGNAGGGIAVFPQSSRTGEQMAEKILDSTINIKPTIYLQPGDRATIMVAHDLDFGGVYELRTR